MAELNINNLTLDDNSFELLPDGDYRFRVKGHSVGYSSSDKMPANTQVITCELEIPFMKDGEVCTTVVKNNLNVYQKALWAIRQFVECIGMAPEKGKVSLDLDKIDGKEGVCSIITRESKQGNEFNNVGQFYAPSKAPAVTSNDDAWLKWNDFTEVNPDDIEFV